QTKKESHPPGWLSAFQTGASALCVDDIITDDFRAEEKGANACKHKLIRDYTLLHPSYMGFVLIFI
ncbi:MAG: hypothetical protein ACPGGB_05160, partial [Flavobacteriales bacterium]